MIAPRSANKIRTQVENTRLHDEVSVWNRSQLYLSPLDTLSKSVRMFATSYSWFHVIGSVRENCCSIVYNGPFEHPVFFPTPPWSSLMGLGVP
jgi:hypothetical protein